MLDAHPVPRLAGSREGESGGFGECAAHSASSERSASAATSRSPARTFGPDLVGNDWTAYRADVVGPLLGAVIAVAFAYVLRGPGGGMAGSAAAQGGIYTEARRPGQG